MLYRRIQQSPKARPKGFTLIEMIIALSIGAAIAVMSYQALDGVISADEIVSEVTGQVNQADRVWQYMSGDLYAVVPRSWVDYSGTKQPALKGEFGGRLSQSSALIIDGDDYLLTFVRGGRSNILGVARSDLFIVGYRLTLDEETDTKILWRDSWSPVDGSEEPKVKKRLLLDGIKDLSLNYCSSQVRFPTDCDTGWPAEKSSGDSASASSPLPAAVKVMVETESLDKVERIFNLAVQS